MNKTSVPTNSNPVNMNATKPAHRRRHARITQIMPLTNEQIVYLRWLLDYSEFLELSGCEQASYDYADSLIDTYNAPLCGRLWSGQSELSAYRLAEYRRMATVQPHDMELAQANVDEHGIRYAGPWAGDDEGVVGA